MYRALIESMLRRGPTPDEAFDRFATKTAPAAVRAARASRSEQRPSTPPARLRSAQPAREQRPAASASRSRRVSVS
jgi:hypothetical protein